MIKLIVFDWDDVFTLGSKEGYISCYHKALVTLGVHLDPVEEKRRIIELWSKPHRDELANLLKERLRYKPQLLDAACKIYEENFFGNTFVDALSYLPGANELLLRLKKKYLLAVATGAHPQVLRKRVFPKFNVPDVFAQILTAYEIDDPEKHKPHPYMLEEIMKTQKVTAAETIFVGDAKTDVQMARSAGVEPIVVLTGHLDRGQAQELNVTHIVPDVTHLLKILEQL